VVGKSYLEQFCPDWKIFSCQEKAGHFHSATGNLIPLGVVWVKIWFKDVSLVIKFVVMENMDLTYFILGNDYLKAFEISLLNDGVQRFTIGSRILLSASVMPRASTF
jgi:hypothetical protein